MTDWDNEREPGKRLFSGFSPSSRIKSRIKVKLRLILLGRVLTFPFSPII